MADDLASRLRRTAIQHLSRREYSRQELRARLERSLRRIEGEPEPAAATTTTITTTDADAGADAGDLREKQQCVIDNVLDELVAAGWQSDERTVSVRIAAKSAAWGSRRLQYDMQRRGLAPELVSQALAPLAQTELERARALWQRRFSEVAATPSERARQARYLAARGFAADTIRRLLKHSPPDEEAGL